MNTRPCKRCGEHIGFIKTIEGALMPVNPGIVIVIEPLEPITLVTSDGRVIKSMTRNDQGYEPHWATCPFAKEFRKKSEGENANDGNKK